MTNEQLYVLKQQERRLLQAVLDETRELLPEDAPRFDKHKPRPLGICAECAFTAKNPNHYEPGDFVALSPLQSHLLGLDEQLERLKSGVSEKVA